MKVDRLIGMILLLLAQGRVSAQDLADRFEVSPRTVYRDMEAIGMAGIPVRSASGVGGGFEIMPDYKVDRKVFTAADLSAILMGLTSLTSIMRGSDLVNALAKVRSFIPADSAGDIDLRANQLLVDLTPWMGNRDTVRHLPIIQTALLENRLLSFNYRDRYGVRTTRTAEPYQLVLKNSHWYFLGYCLIRDDFRLFKLTRISGLRMLKTVFTPRAYSKPQLDFSEVWTPLQTPIKLRIHESIQDRVLDYCPYDHFTPDGNAHYIVRFPFIENDFYYHILFSFGDRCECLAPPSVRAEMQRRLHAMAAIYDKPTNDT